MARGTRGSSFKKGFDISGAFDDSNFSKSFPYNTFNVDNSLVGNYDDFGQYKDIYAPEEKSINHLQNFLNFKLQKPDEDSTATKIAEGIYKSYRPKEKSSQEKIADLIASRLGGSGSGVQDVGGGLRIAQATGGLRQPIVIPGQEGSGGLGGLIKGAAGGFLSGGTTGAIIGGIGGLF